MPDKDFIFYIFDSRFDMCMLNIKTLFHTKLLITGLMILCFHVSSKCQPAPSHQLYIEFVSKDSSFNPAILQLQTVFKDQPSCISYINTLPDVLAKKGYLTASVDTIWHESSGSTHIALFVGKQYQWLQLIPESINPKALNESGFMDKQFTAKPFNIAQVEQLQNRLLNYYENNGYPFAKVFMDSVQIQNDKVKALLKVSTGPQYHIDSIRVMGKAKLSKKFLQHYLELPNGSIFN